MLKAAEDKNVVISFYQRKIIDSFRKPTARYAAESEAVADRNLEHILAFRPDGVAWLHAAATDVPQMLRLLEQKVPTVSTKRHLPGVEVPILREDDLVFASLALTQFQARGHRRIGLIIRSPEDDYFKSKIEALETVGKSLGITVEPSDYFCLEASPADLTANASESTITDLEAFLLQRPQVTGMLVVAASGIHALIEILRRNQSRQLQQLSIIHNTLDGVRIPPLPGGHSLATISPPLEDLGNQIVHALTKVAQRQPMPDMPRLVPTFQPGTSLKTAPPAEE
jgi:DNA-binding LacI/PurR family transcriptional regulator